MPSFKFRGFTSASLVALTVAQGAQSVSASTTWGLAQATPNASFTIQLIDGCTDIVAPYGAVLRATRLHRVLGVGACRRRQRLRPDAAQDHLYLGLRRSGLRARGDAEHPERPGGT
jgi:hypothetical protein